MVVFGAGDVYRFSGNETHTDHFKLVLLDGNSILIGGRNLVHNLSVSDLSERQVLQWYSTDDNTRMCALKGKDEDACQNYIRILSKMDNNRLLVCGTNSFKPLCREYEIKGVQEILDLQGIREDARRSSTSPNTLFCL
ncbi:hypothetical protein M8J76_001259 [Diaphorina citri]|nr:hypothetical protein M8J76_001259 [Diaphorina citri]